MVFYSHFTLHLSQDMSDAVIKVENLSKKYIISHQGQERYTALRDVMTDGIKRLGKKLLSPFTFHSSQPSNSPFTFHDSPFTASEEFWALKDVSFEIKQGDRVGIIGRNGAGKSTLLKILSRITEPTSGLIEIAGRVASLLEVGTGFHPELTGRENIYLNGAILGMSRVDIKRKFDEIVAFAEVEKFLDTPVKRYSSGMYVRLAFAVAAHLEPEILIIDEVLAVGDAHFQKKCLGKMEDVSSKEGRTVLFVSHNMTAISNLCKMVIVLQNGTLQFTGDTQSGIDHYMTNNAMNTDGLDYSDRKIHDGKLTFSWFHNISLLTLDDQSLTEIRIGEGLKIVLEFELFENVPALELGACVHNLIGQRYSHFIAEWEGLPTTLERGRHTLECEIPELYLLPGMYEISAWIKQKGGPPDDDIHSACKFTVIGADITGHQADFERYPNLGMYIKSRWTRKA